MTRVTTHNRSNAFSQPVNHLNWLSGLYGHASLVLSISWNDVSVSRDNNQNFTVHVWQVEHTLITVLNHSISMKNCFYASMAPLKMI